MLWTCFYSECSVSYCMNVMRGFKQEGPDRNRIRERFGTGILLRVCYWPYALSECMWVAHGIWMQETLRRCYLLPFLRLVIVAFRL